VPHDELGPRALGVAQAARPPQRRLHLPAARAGRAVTAPLRWK
jgi:hypothetical protein